MPRWLRSVLIRIHDLAAQRRVRFTLKARIELAEISLGLDAEDARDVLGSLSARDFIGRLISDRTGEWLYVFKPRVFGMTVYVKLVLRNQCVIVSFHEDLPDGHEENN
jgi:hypothetical protein